MTHASASEPKAMDGDLQELDDLADRDELRQRYYGLLQELRVVLPGVQVLLAFLLTAPFSDRFEELDGTGRLVFAVSLGASLTSVICLMAPAVFHRVAQRTTRVARLAWSVRLALVGMWLLAAALLASLWNVIRFMYDTAAASIVVGFAAVVVLSLWLAVPLAYRRPAGQSRADEAPPR